jgi:repressor LexA
VVLSKEALGRLIKEARKIKSEATKAKYTQEMLANDIGISRSYLGDIEAGRKYPNFVLLSKIADICKLPLNFFEKQVTYEFVPEHLEVKESGKSFPNLIIQTQIPIVGVIHAGEPFLAEQNIEGYFPTDNRFMSQDHEYFYLRIAGDSMDKEFKEDSLVLVQRQDFVSNNEIGVVLIDGMDATVKKIVIDENLITLIPCSNNSEHMPKTYDMNKVDVRILGKVVLAVKKY